MVFSWQDIYSLGAHHVVSFLNCIEISHLVGAFTHLSFPVEHEAATEREDLVVVSA